MKDGIKFPKLNVDISNWYGRIMELDKKFLEIELDSITLKEFDKSLLQHFINIEEYPHIITIPKKDVQKSEERDQYEHVLIEQDKLIDIIESSNNDPDFQKLSRKWTRHFIRSEHYRLMDKPLRVDSDSVIEMFTNQMHDYEGKTPKRWTKSAAREVFLHWVPNKISADTEYFKSYGIILLNFFAFLNDAKYLNTKPLIELLEEVKEEIVLKSQDSSNWGIAKSFMMGAINSGVNLDNKESMRIKS